MKTSPLRPSFVATFAAAGLAVAVAPFGDAHADPPQPTVNPPPPPMPQPTVNPPPPPQLMVNPPPPREPGRGRPAIGPGRRRCAFVEAGHRYDRTCTVTRQPDGSLRVVAPGTRLNPNNGFTLTLTAVPGGYQVAGSLTAFAACTGPVDGIASFDARGRPPAYRVSFRGCEVAIGL
jgi:hypothetical protein